eukprot:g739.t1
MAENQNVDDLGQSPATVPHTYENVEEQVLVEEETKETDNDLDELEELSHIFDDDELEELSHIFDEDELEELSHILGEEEDGEKVDSKTLQLFDGGILVKSVFDDSDISSVFQIEKLVLEDPKVPAHLKQHSRNFGTGTQHNILGHNVTYLHSHFDRVNPTLLERIEDTMLEHVVSADWRIFELSQGKDINVRCMELIRYHAQERKEGERKEDTGIGFHTDSLSLVTVAVMLSDEKEFSGGGFQIRDDSLKLHTYFPQRGDMMIWKPWLSHGVVPITKGLRNVLVFEWWNTDRIQPHSSTGRPEAPREYCSYPVCDYATTHKGFGISMDVYCGLQYCQSSRVQDMLKGGKILQTARRKGFKERDSATCFMSIFQKTGNMNWYHEAFNEYKNTIMPMFEKGNIPFGQFKTLHFNIGVLQSSCLHMKKNVDWEKVSRQYKWFKYFQVFRKNPKSDITTEEIKEFNRKFDKSVEKHFNMFQIDMKKRK